MTKSQPDLDFEWAQRTADARDDGIPGAAFRLRIDQVEAVDRSARLAGEVAAAVAHDPLPLRGDREERRRDARVVECGARRAQVLLQVARRRVAVLVLARVDRQHGASVRAVEALAAALLGVAVRLREDAGRIV